jgi:hypothetical protein
MEETAGMDKDKRVGRDMPVGISVCSRCEYVALFLPEAGACGLSVNTLVEAELKSDLGPAPPLVLYGHSGRRLLSSVPR